MKEDYKINLEPSESDLKEIENWLLDESKKYDDGFYCNWNIIERSYHKNEVISFELNEKIIGFVVWSQREIYTEIDILEIHPEFRRKGLGKIFYDKIEKSFKERGSLAIKLFCEPKESEKFWRKMGFIQFPIRGYSESKLTFYKPLIDSCKPTDKSNDLNKIELWDVEPYQANKKEPRWIWEIKMENNKLIYPIIQPCNVNWNVRWTKNGKIIKEAKVKYFSRENPIEFSPFMYIEYLNEK
ncbi:GNAT family N-acetyltransferase [Thermophagus xiamenensis]|uniref:Acetyltransferase (GNAT) family protein n=1 Tax=Thermophagus xiamenensis TaxID=385682 RepID=A0A1I1US45_9BACT|nr:GNAT family N-acetyltransferase [Thermophagus xiamenensis]SFD70810.1 Acetyltransferase (GNAT) family protein [Thermophagus xiamenensis]